MKQNIRWTTKTEETDNNELETLTCYDENNEELIKITMGNYLNYWRSDLKKIYDIEFCTRQIDLIPKLELLLKDKLIELKSYVLDFSIEYWEKKILAGTRYITNMYHKSKNNEELSHNELAVLYGLYFPNLGEYNEKTGKLYYNGFFNYDQDPRIPEILKNRDQQDDFKYFSENAKIEILLNAKKCNLKYNFKTDNRHIILSCNSLEYAADSLLSNSRFIREYIKKSDTRESILKYTKENINKNKAIVLLILQTKINDDFKYAAPKLRDDKDVALTAVKFNGLMLEYVGDTIKNDKDIIINALIQNKDAKQFIDPSILEQYPEINSLLSVLEIIDEYINLPSEEQDLVKDKLFKLISLLPEELKNNYPLMKKAFKVNRNIYTLSSNIATRKRLERKIKKY